jgi:hypothetical protein
MLPTGTRKFIKAYKSMQISLQTFCYVSMICKLIAMPDSMWLPQLFFSLISEENLYVASNKRLLKYNNKTASGK